MTEVAGKLHDLELNVLINPMLENASCLKDLDRSLKWQLQLNELGENICLSHPRWLRRAFRYGLVICSIVHDDERRLVEVWQQLILPPLDKVLAIEVLVVVSAACTCGLGAKGPNRARNKSGWRTSGNAWALDCCQKTVPPTLGGWGSCGVKHVIRVVQRVFKSIVMLVNVGFIQVNLTLAMSLGRLSVIEKRLDVLVSEHHLIVANLERSSLSATLELVFD
mmetsp:Transcript_1885/g.5720  ORF Transcript_1885/g.5720 Transcript_1885/m.5720 type:complete len:222 (-) Transcript_1885:933-1598(-)